MTDISTEVSLTVYAGVDTHKEVHHAAVIDHLGRPIADHAFPADPAGYRQLLAWITGCGLVAVVGIEGTGTYGTALAAAARKAGITVVEVDRPDRKARRSNGKSDPVDAYAAATAALTGRATTVPKTRDGDVESIRLLHTARRTAVKARAEAVTALKSMIVSVPAALREQLRELTDAALFRTCARLRPAAAATDTVTAAAKTALRSIARRVLALGVEIKAFDVDLKRRTAAAAPELLALTGVGPETAAQLLITVGDNRGRIASEASFANLCGVAPRQASSGKTHRHRLSRSGDRQANRALHVIALTRVHHDPRTSVYVERRTAEGKSQREIVRCLKRALAREIYGVLKPKSAPCDSTP